MTCFIRKHPLGGTGIIVEGRWTWRKYHRLWVAFNEGGAIWLPCFVFWMHEGKLAYIDLRLPFCRWGFGWYRSKGFSLS